MTKPISLIAAAVVALAASTAPALAEETDARGKELLAAAEACYKTYAKSVAPSAGNAAEIPAAVGSLQNYICLRDTQIAAQYVRNTAVVVRYADRIKERFNREIAVDPETGWLLTDLTYNDIGSTGWQDLLNAISLNSDPYNVYVQPLPSMTQMASRIVLEAMTAGE